MATPNETVTPPMSSEDKANAAKYNTPLPPNDPASLNNARQDANYIGPTNFSKIQTQYTPYQIEQATERRGNDIFWKQGVDINTIPPSSNGTANLTVPKNKTPLPTESASTSSVSMTRPGDTTSNFGRMQADTATKYLGGIDKSIDDLLAEQQRMQTEQKTQAEDAVSGLKGALGKIMNTSQYQDTLARDRKLFEVTQTIADLNMIRGKIADATSALEQGLIYEEGRPVRMQLLSGRMSELKKQGVAGINALTGVAEVLKGNIELARAYADDSIAAAKADNNEKIQAINTLLDMENAKLIRLSDDEKETIAARRKLLTDESARLEKDKDDVFDLATKYPQSFAKAGVTFLDSRETATQKMLPFLSEREKMDLEAAKLDLEAKRANIAKTNRTGTGSGSGSSSSPFQAGSDAESYVAAAFSAGRKVQDVIKDLQDPRLLGRPLTSKELNWVQDYFSKASTGGVTEDEDILTEQADATWLKSVGLDPTDPANRKYIGMKKQAVIDATNVKPAEAGSGFGAQAWNAVKAGGKYLLDKGAEGFKQFTNPWGF